MKRRRDSNLEEYGISEYAYREMVYFCMQYYEKREMLNSLYGVKAIRYDGEKMGGRVSDIVFEQAQRALMIKNDIEIIEKAAEEADEVLKGKIIENVCGQMAFEYMDIPCGRRQFYNKRKLFFIRLFKHLNERKKVTQVT